MHDFPFSTYKMCLKSQDILSHLKKLSPKVWTIVEYYHRENKYCIIVVSSESSPVNWIYHLCILCFYIRFLVSFRFWLPDISNWSWLVYICKDKNVVYVPNHNYIPGRSIHGMKFILHEAPLEQNLPIGMNERSSILVLWRPVNFFTQSPHPVAYFGGIGPWPPLAIKDFSPKEKIVKHGLASLCVSTSDQQKSKFGPLMKS